MGSLYIMKRAVWGVIAFAVVLSILADTTSADARSQRIANLSVDLDGGFVSVSAQLIDSFSHETEEDIKNGVPKDLYYTILLKRRKSAWFDEEIVSRTILYRVKGDLLKKQYVIQRKSGGREEDEMILDDYGAMQRLISRIGNVRIASVESLDKKATYYVSVKAEMKATKIPLYLDYILFFVPFLEVDTPWTDSAPFYRPAGNK